MNLEDRVLAQQRAHSDTSALIEEYLPFIASCASKHTGRRVGPDQDELPVAMFAFHEAVRTFDGRKGKFLPYASLVMRHRLIDHTRSNDTTREIPFSAMTAGAEEEQEPFEVADSSQEERRDIAQEIEALSAELLTYHISFNDLAAASPRSGKTRRACAAAVRALLANPLAFEQVAASGMLPMIYLTNVCRLPRKTLDRHRKYIIAATVILTHDYPCLSEYVSYITGEMRL